jgi:hypothetical protein
MRSVRDEEMEMCFSKKEGQVWLSAPHWLHTTTWLIGNPPFGHEQFVPTHLGDWQSFRHSEVITRLRISRYAQRFPRSCVAPGESGAESLW